jgi:two-component sensor histidine kinase
MNPFNGSVSEKVIDFLPNNENPAKGSQICFNVFREINRICKQTRDSKKLLERVCDKLNSCHNFKATLIATLDQDEELIFYKKTDPENELDHIVELLDDDELPAEYHKSVTQLASQLPSLAHGVTDNGQGLLVCALRYSDVNYGFMLVRYRQKIEQEELVFVGDIAGEIAFTLHNQELEKERLRIEAKAQRDLREKDVLLAEIHHRVKNNLQIVSGLLFLQSRRTQDTGSKNVLDESLNRVRSMALIHEQLYQSRDFSRVNIKSYIERISRNLTSVYSASSMNVAVTIEMEEIYFSIDTAIPCGLIINELLSNSLKYAFPHKSDKQGTISISMIHEDGYIIIKVKDDGIGMPPNSLPGQNESCGLEIVKMLSEEQLEGTLFIDNHNGAEFTLKFENPGLTF